MEGKRTDVGAERDNEVGYAAKRMAEECSMMGLDGIERYTSMFLEVCMRNCASLFILN